VRDAALVSAKAHLSGVIGAPREYLSIPFGIHRDIFNSFRHRLLEMPRALYVTVTILICYILKAFWLTCSVRSLGGVEISTLELVPDPIP
jgi:hypothetical protein